MKTEQELRARITKFQEELGLKDNGWALGSEVAEIKEKICVLKIGDWRDSFRKAYNLAYDVFVFEKATLEDY